VGQTKRIALGWLKMVVLAKRAADKSCVGALWRQQATLWQVMAPYTFANFECMYQVP
jgi:hypothetical protein